MTAERTLDARALNRALLARQMLLERVDASAHDAVARVAGLQAQVPRPPFVGLWTRLRDFARDELLDAVRRRELVRATTMRGTIHLLTADDYCAFRGALQPALSRGVASVGKGWVDSTDLDALDACGRAFFGARPATFDALRDHIAAEHAERFGGNVRLAAYALRMRLPLVQVPEEDAAWGWPASAAFALADEWLGRPVSTASDDARALVRRYLAAFGPATPADAQAWSGLQGLRATFDAMRDELVVLRDSKKRELFDLPDAPRPGADVDAPPRLLPEFDTAILGHADRTRILPDEYRPGLVTKNLLVPATVLVNGFVAGTWTTERKRKVAALVITPFDRIAKKQRVALEEEGEALLAFTEPDSSDREVRWND